MTVILLAMQANLGFSMNCENHQDALEEIHNAFDALLKKYVTGAGVKYSAWRNNDADMDKLQKYVAFLETQNPECWSRDDGLAYWINLYNAATVRLILQNYPVKSIKDLGNFIKTPWKKRIVSVAGRELTLDQIENKIIRPQFEDARIHFALNCASIGCPPLAPFAFRADSLELLLEAVTKNALSDEKNVKVEKDIVRVTKIFDWYEEDFVKESGSVRDFLAHYLPEQKHIFLNKNVRIENLSYSWKLNQAGDQP